MRRNAELASALLVGVGAAFDFLAGTKARAPVWAQRSGLEWFFRLASEPRRLVGRLAAALLNLDPAEGERHRRTRNELADGEGAARDGSGAVVSFALTRVIDSRPGTRQTQ